MTKSTLTEVCTVLYVVLFLYTGVSKLIDYNTFKVQLGEVPILKPFATIIAISLPVLELIIVLMLIIPKWRIKGLYLSLILMFIFTAYVVMLLQFSKELPCSCGGILQELSWPQHLLLNFVFILFAFYAIATLRKIHIQNNKEATTILVVKNDSQV